MSQILARGLSWCVKKHCVCIDLWVYLLTVHEQAFKQSDFKPKPDKTAKIEIKLKLMHGALAFKVNGQPFGLTREDWHVAEKEERKKKRKPSTMNWGWDGSTIAKVGLSVLAATTSLGVSIWRLIENTN